MARYAEEFPHSSRSYGAFGRDFIQAAARAQRPFCLSVSFKAPHKPDQPDPKFDHVYAGRTFAKPANYGRDKGAHFAPQSRGGRQYERFVSWGYRDRYDEVMAIYHQLVYGVDVAVGMIRAAVEAAGVADNTVFIFTSDNGFLCGSHGYGSKVLPYEEASNVPLIIYDPRHPNSGRRIRCGALTGNIDIAPTILALAGLEPTENMDGRNLMVLYDNPGAALHGHLPLINVWGPKQVQSFGVVTRDYKYIWWPYASQPFTATEELYHIAEDPLELANLAPQTGQEEALGALRSTYDQAVRAWQEDAVPYHNYQDYGRIFSRSHTWTP
jgi:arylsulfatase A-like enzyme